MSAPDSFSLNEIATNIVDGPFGSSLKTSDYVDEGIPVLQGKNITGNRFSLSDIRYISFEKAEELKRSKVFVGDHLLVKIGSIGYSAIVDDLAGHAFAIIPANLAKVTPDLERVDPRYLHQWLVSDEATRYFKRVASKTAQPALSLTKIRELRVPLPPLPEQRRIAAILDKADALRAKRREAIAKLDQLLQSVFLEMFGDPVTNPKGWQQKELSEICDPADRVNYGVVQPGEAFPDGVPLIRVGDIDGGQLNFSSIKRIDPAIESSYGRSRLKGTELLVSCVGSIGTIAYVPEEARGYNIARAITRVPLANPENRAFVRECLRSPAVQRHFSEKTRTVSQPTLNVSFVKSAPIICPPDSLITKFCGISDAIEQRIRSLMLSAEKSTALFSALQKIAFSDSN